MGPQADFACLSKKCQQDGAASVYELPVSATRCPVCGSKRLQRLYNTANVLRGAAPEQDTRYTSSSIARRTDAIAEPAYEQAMAPKQAAAASRQRTGPMIAVPVNQLGSALARVHPAFGQVALGNGKAVANSSPPHWEGPILRKLPPRPDASSLRDRDYRVTVKKDAKGRFVNAEVVRA